MLPEYKIGLFISPSADPRLSQAVFESATKFEGVFTDSMRFTGQPFQLPGKAIVVGGEGTIRIVIQQMHMQRNPIPLAVYPGGSTNVLFEDRKATARMMTLQEFIETPADQFDSKFKLQSGIIEDGRENTDAFNIQLGLGKFERFSGSTNHFTRKIPRAIRPLISRVMASVPAAVMPGDALNMYSLSPRIGHVLTFPDQDLSGSGITHAKIEGNRVVQAAKLATTLILWQFGWRPPKGILHIETGATFHDEVKRNTIWFDGDTQRNRFSGHVTIRRTDPQYAIPVVGIKAG